jgi:hypothetical protein
LSNIWFHQTLTIWVMSRGHHRERVVCQGNVRHYLQASMPWSNASQGLNFDWTTTYHLTVSLFWTLSKYNSAGWTTCLLYFILILC